MNTQTFNTAIEDQIQRCKDTLIKKSDYGTDTDRLHNFQAYADLAGVTLEQACGGFLGKHIVSIYDLIREGAQGTASTRGIWDEKIGDAINYLLILSAIVRRFDADKREQRTPNQVRLEMGLPPIEDTDYRKL